MKQIIFAFALSLAANASAKDFSERVAEARAAASTPAGAEYERSLGAQYGDVMRTCIPPGSSSKADVGAFSLVGYVSASGELSDVVVEPVTPASQCFASHLRTMPLPPPPSASAATTGYPIQVQMKVVP